ncbi:hypothetical protein ACFYW9_40910, partial [Streptomyces sp. NPDC002698]|uniref:hypothetical protein n=1 Tax=Streptomyces sp. NPDC002698 TaxID=3364660 RepID=UPI0036B7DDDC
MTTKEELEAEYDDARTELDRANLELFMVKRWARLSGRTPDAEDLVDVQRRIRVAGRQVLATENAMKAAGWVPSRGPAKPKGPLTPERRAEIRAEQLRAAEERNRAREAAGL